MYYKDVKDGTTTGLTEIELLNFVEECKITVRIVFHEGTSGFPSAVQQRIFCQQKSILM